MPPTVGGLFNGAPTSAFRPGRRVVGLTTVASKLVGLFPQIDEKEQGAPRWPKVRDDGC
jgi:hypothetical protein